MYISLNEDNYIACAMEKYMDTPNGLIEQNVDGMIEVEFDGDFSRIHDYQYIDGKLILNESLEEERQRAKEEFDNFYLRQNNAINILPDYMEENDVAICELYEMVIGI